MTDIIDCHVVNIIDKDISDKYSENAKTGNVTKMKNYKSVTSLKIFSKINKRF